MELLREAGRLDLAVAPATSRERPVRRAANGVAACSPPRGSQKRPVPQVRRAGGGRGGRLASASMGRVGEGVVGRPRPLGARRPNGTRKTGAGGGVGAPFALMLKNQKGRRRPALSGARAQKGGMLGAVCPMNVELPGFHAGGLPGKKAKKGCPSRVVVVKLLR
ncbi:hypothetical protein NDU88_002756 [Pleurodeles waltl]|uniref:Uncharacterized protein n=1 Tax=Pleurodeles waltl TaxID=8319 RepID=A0AAV7KT11_PLEWA|nr:hypothetical protein NDU88_002756 [Pleurodeles waltl]